MEKKNIGPHGILFTASFWESNSRRSLLGQIFKFEDGNMVDWEHVE